VQFVTVDPAYELTQQTVNSLNDLWIKNIGSNFIEY